CQMIGAINTALQVYSFCFQLLRLGESSFLPKDGSKGIHRHNRVMVLGSKYATLYFQGLALQSFGFLETPFHSGLARHIPHGNQRVRVLWPEYAPLTLQSGALHLLCFCSSPLLDKGTSQRIHRTQCFGIPSSAGSAVKLDGSLQ